SGCPMWLYVFLCSISLTVVATKLPPLSLVMGLLPPTCTLFPYTTLFRSRLVNLDRNTPMLLPPSLHEWVEQDDLVHPLMQARRRSEEHTSELQSPYDLVCRLLLEKKQQRSKYEVVCESAPDAHAPLHHTP